MKNLIIPFFLFPLFSFAQYGLRDCHTDFVLGYDYGEVIFLEDKNNDRDFSSIQSFRFGVNVTYPVSHRSFLATGIRVASKSITDATTSFPQISEDGLVNHSRRFNTYQAEVPFNFRYLVKNIGRDSRFFVEGGLQFNFYAFSISTEKKYDMDGVILEEKMLERNERFNDFNLSSQLSIGWEYDISEKLKYFIQPIGRFQMLPSRRDFHFREYHVGVETGVRF